MKFLCDKCQAKYQIADEKAAGKTVRMKCRKCGHLIEVRSTVADPSESMSGSLGVRQSLHPTAKASPAPPRATSGGGTAIMATRPSARPGDAGSLSRAFRSNVQREDEVSAPVDMSDLSAADEWYVAINGVPVGPIRIAEVRRKAAIGAVTEDSLCWQEGLDEWRPLRSFPDLAAIVREAFASGRSSLVPQPPEGRPSAVPPRAPAATSAPRATTGRAAGSPMAPAPATRNNVVPITSRLATAEKLDEPMEAPRRPTHPPAASPFTSHSHSVVPDPFAAPPPPAPGPMAPARLAPSGPPAPIAAHATVPFVSASPSFPEGLSPALPPKKSPPWIPIAMVASAIAFGVTAGLAVFLRPPPAAAPVVVQIPTAPGTAASPSPNTSAAVASNDSPSPSVGTARGPIAMATAPRNGGGAGASPSAAAPAGMAGHGLDLHGLSPGSNVLPTDDPGGESNPRPVAGQGVSGAQVSQVVGLHQVALRRNCWERNPSQKTAVNISVTFTVAGDGSVQGVSASGDEPSIANCIANDVRGWHFPATGTSQPVNVPFHFVKQ